MRKKHSVGDWIKNREEIQEELNKTKQDFLKICDALKVSANIDLVLAEIKKLIELEDKYNQKDKQLAEANLKIDDLTTKLAKIGFEHTTLIEDHQKLQEKVTKYEKRVDEQGKELSAVSEALQELKTQFAIDPSDGWAWIFEGLKKILGRK